MYRKKCLQQYLLKKITFTVAHVSHPKFKKSKVLHCWRKQDQKWSKMPKIFSFVKDFNVVGKKKNDIKSHA